MKYPPFRTLFLLAPLLLALGNARAEDIDLYAGAGANPALPNVLFVFDNAAAFSASAGGFICTYPASAGGGTPSLNGTAAGIQQCALVNAIAALPDNTVNIGLMVYNENQMTGSPVVFAGTGASTPLSCGNGTGGCLVQPITAMTSAAKTRLISFIKSWKDSGTSDATSFNIKSNTTRTGAVMQESWAYYAGNTGLSGRNYSGIQPPAGCQQNYVIFIGNAVGTAGSPGDGSGSNVDGTLQAAPGVTAAQLVPITATYARGAMCNTANPFYSMPNHTVPSGLWADEWARYMKGSDIYSTVAGTQNITTYTIGVLDPATCKADFPALLTSMANVGGGEYFATTDFSSLSIAIARILNKIQAVNSAFASASLPVSVNTQGTFLNQIYMGMFRPDADGKPRWPGNLKQYQFGVDISPPFSVFNPRLFLADKNGRPAISGASDSGFIAVDAVSFWTSKNTAALPDSVGGFWKNASRDVQGFSGGYDEEDGNIVEKGGVSQQIRLENLTVDYATSPAGPRRLYTCIGTCTPLAGISLSTMPFATTNTNLTDSVLGISGSGLAISSITRVANTATVNLVAAMSPVMANGTSVVISGNPAYNGVYTAGGPPTADTFTVPISTSPPATATGVYTASTTSGGSQAIASLTRSADGTLVRANLPGHGYANNQIVSISGASTGFNVSAAPITFIDVNNFDYAPQVGPVSPDGGGTATVSGKAVQTIETAANNGLVRSGNFGVSPTFYQNVTARTTANHPFVANDPVMITAAGYDGTYTITGTGSSCPGVPSQPNRYFCFNIATTPSATAAAPGAVSTGSTANISSLTRTTNTCTGGSPSANATVTATTSTNHGFATNDFVTISAANPVAGESLYTGSKQITVTGPTTFTYTVTTSPACTDNTAGMTASISGVDRTTMINWVRGYDNLGDEPSPSPGVINIRPSVHGEVLHSRPAVISYGATPDVVVFYGSNDGVFRAVNGNKTGSINGVPPGGELWGFIPTEFYLKLQRQVLNSPIVKLYNTDPNNTILPAPQPKEYFFDGGIGVYQNLTLNQAYIFLAARRGGRILYAIDVSAPSDPKFLWKKSCPNLNNNTGCDAGFEELGQTWSQPKPTRVRGVADPVLIFGAGYSATQDTEPPTADTMGRGIFILNARTGDLVWRAGPGGSSSTCAANPCLLPDMTYAIPSDITLIDRDGDGFVERLYATDVGGNVWRVDLEPSGATAPANWQVTKLAALGGSGTTKRKFFFPADVVATSAFDAVLAGTGDREHPVFANSSTNIVNKFYMLKDLRTGNNACSPTCTATIVDGSDPTWPGTAGSTASLFDATTTLYNNTLSGFFVRLLNLVTNTDGTQGSVTEKGEKVVNAPISVGGSTFFGTSTPIPPNPNVCSANLGTARGYSIDFVTGSRTFVVFRGGGLVPTAVTGLVSVDVGGRQTLVRFIIGGGGGGQVPCTGDGCGPTPPGPAGPGNCPPGTDFDSAQGVCRPVISLPQTRTRTYWYRQHDK